MGAADEDVVEILERNMPVAETWGRVAVFDAIRASGADEEYNDDEKEAVRRVATRLGVSEDVVSALESLYLEEQQLKRKRIDLVFGEDIPYQTGLPMLSECSEEGGRMYRGWGDGATVRNGRCQDP